MTDLPETGASGDARAYYARTYDQWVPDWLGELDFYRELALSAPGPTLELAAGTGRIAIRLADAGVHITALDHAPEMLAVARAKTEGRHNPVWVEADMRSFQLPDRYGLAIIPGHSFQNLTTPADQRACLDAIRRHLLADGRLAIHLDHQDIDWLGELTGRLRGVFEAGEEFEHPTSGRRVRSAHAWSYERATQTATVQTRWEELGDDGRVVSVVLSEPARLHCIFPFEMHHLLDASGFAVERVSGDFEGGPLVEESAEMVWLARPAPT